MKLKLYQIQTGLNIIEVKTSCLYRANKQTTNEKEKRKKRKKTASLRSRHTSVTVLEEKSSGATVEINVIKKEAKYSSPSDKAKTFDL